MLIILNSGLMMVSRCGWGTATFSITTLSITTLSIIDIIGTLNIIDIILTFSIMTLGISTECYYAECVYVEGHIFILVC